MGQNEAEAADLDYSLNLTVPLWRHNYDALDRRNVFFLRVKRHGTSPTPSTGLSRITGLLECNETPNIGLWHPFGRRCQKAMLGMWVRPTWIQWNFKHWFKIFFWKKVPESEAWNLDTPCWNTMKLQVLFTISFWRKVPEGEARSFSGYVLLEYNETSSTGLDILLQESAGKRGSKF